MERPTPSETPRSSPQTGSGLRDDPNSEVLGGVISLIA